MAIFHLTVKSVSRGKGQSAVAKAAYNSRQELRDERTGELKDYTRQADAVSFSGIFAPPNAPKWTQDRAALWNAVEQSEKRKDARLATEIEIALPHELTDDQRKQLVTDFTREQFARRGIVADVNIHKPPREPREGEQPNHHAHILLTLREIDRDGFGKRLPECDQKEVQRLRAGWEKLANRYLERHGHEARIDRRTLKEQGIDREPTRHRGPQVDAMQRRGIETDRAASTSTSTGRKNGSGPGGGDLQALRADVVAMRQNIRRELRSGQLTDTRRTFLQEKAAELRELQSDIRAEIAPQRTRSLGKAAGGGAARVLDGAATLAAAPLEVISNMFGASVPTREQVQARHEAREQAAAAAVAEATKQAKEPDKQPAPEIVDRLKYTSDPAYRRQVDAADRRLREDAERQQRTDEKDRGRSRER